MSIPEKGCPDSSRQDLGRYKSLDPGLTCLLHLDLKEERGLGVLK